MKTILSTANVRPRERMSYWFDETSKVFVSHEIRIQAPLEFDATVSHVGVGQLDLIEINSTGFDEAGRTKKNISRGEDEVFYLCLQLEGSADVIQDGRNDTVHVGDLHLQDTRRPYWSRYSQHSRQLLMRIPHRALNARISPTSQLTARAVRYGSGLTSLVSDYLRLLPARAAGLSGNEGARVAEHVLDLVAMALAAHHGDSVPKLSSARTAAILRLRTAVEQLLDNPHLDPEAVAGAAGISVRYANALLANEGLSLERLIVARRLERCRLALADARQAHRSVGEIAYAWGFSDQSHFTRRFKAAYGCSPSDFRKQNGA